MGHSTHDGARLPTALLLHQDPRFGKRAGRVGETRSSINLRRRENPVRHTRRATPANIMCRVSSSPRRSLSSSCSVNSKTPALSGLFRIHTHELPIRRQPDTARLHTERSAGLRAGTLTGAVLLCMTSEKRDNTRR